MKLSKNAISSLKKEPLVECVNKIPDFEPLIEAQYDGVFTVKIIFWRAYI